MPPGLQFMLALAIIVAAAKLGGLASQRLHQPAVLGELLVGLILGPTVLNIFHWPIFSDEHLAESVQHVAEIGVILLMFYAGLEIHLEDMLKSGRVAMFAGVAGVVVPLVLGALSALPFGYPLVSALFIGTILTATSVSISAQTLMELNVLRRPPGLALLGAAVIDDVLVILVLSLFVAIVTGGNGGILGLGWVIVRMVLYLVGTWYIGLWLLPRLAGWVSRRQISEGLVALVVISALLLSVAAETLGGVAAITGAFLAGVIFSRSPVRHQIQDRIHVLTYGFFVPIFFVSIGLLANVRLLTPQLLPFVALISLVAVISKIIGSGVGALFGGFAPRQSLQVGIGMVSRGEVGLIVAAIGIDNRIISSEVFTIAVVMVLVTTLVTPLLLRWAFQGEEAIEAVEMQSANA